MSREPAAATLAAVAIRNRLLEQCRACVPEGEPDKGADDHGNDGAGRRAGACVLSDRKNLDEHYEVLNLGHRSCDDREDGSVRRGLRRSPL